MPTHFVYPNTDTLRAQAITSGWRQQYDETLWDWLESNGYTQDSLNDKIHAAEVAGFDFTTFISTARLLENGSYRLLENGSILLLG